MKVAKPGYMFGERTNYLSGKRKRPETQLAGLRQVKMAH